MTIICSQTARVLLGNYVMPEFSGYHILKLLTQWLGYMTAVILFFIFFKLFIWSVVRWRVNVEIFCGSYVVSLTTGVAQLFESGFSVWLGWFWFSYVESSQSV